MIRVEHHEPAKVVEIVIDRPEKRNALTPDMQRNLADAVVRAHESHARAVVLCGAGDVFCAGFDLALCREDASVMGDLLTTLSRALRAVRRLSCPVVVAAQGGAVAGGCALLSACDIVVSDRAATLGYPVVRLGVSPAVTSPLLRLSVNSGRTRERLLDPATITGERAHELGLVHHLVETPAEVRPRALAVAAELAAKPPHALSATKRWLNELDGSDNDALFTDALRASLSIAGGPEERALLASVWKK